MTNLQRARHFGGSTSYLRSYSGDRSIFYDCLEPGRSLLLLVTARCPVVGGALVAEIGRIDRLNNADLPLIAINSI